MDTPQPVTAPSFGDQMIRAFAFIARPSFEGIQPAAVEVINGFTKNQEGIVGTVEAQKVAQLVFAIMEPIKRLYVVGLSMTAALFFASHFVLVVPAAPSILLLLSGAAGVATWEVRQLLIQLRCAHFALQMLGGEVAFDQLANMVQRYAGLAIANTDLISSVGSVRASLEGLDPLLRALVEQQNTDHWGAIVKEHLPVAPLLAPHRGRTRAC